MVGWSCPTGPATSQMPASPARAPESPKQSQVVPGGGKPPKPLARGASPLVRISKPLRVRDMNTDNTTTTMTANTAPRCTRPSPKVASRCQSLKLMDLGKLNPWGSRHGPLTSQSRRYCATYTSIRLVRISLAPKRLRSSAGTPAQAIPPSMPNSIMAGIARAESH